MTMTIAKRTEGNFFEDFKVGHVFRHAVPADGHRGRLALYIALTGDRRPRTARGSSRSRWGSSGRLCTTCSCSTSSSGGRCRMFR